MCADTDTLFETVVVGEDSNNCEEEAEEEDLIELTELNLDGEEFDEYNA